LIASVAVVLGDWKWYVTFSDDCQTPVAVQLTSGIFCARKRSDQGVRCDPLEGYPTYSFYGNSYCGTDMPNITEIASLPVAILTYPSSENCTEKDYVRNYYLAENYEGPMVVSNLDSVLEVAVNTTCSDAGVLSSLLCFSGSCLNLTVSAQCTIDIDNELSLSQTGCVALPPTTTPASGTPTTVSGPQAQPTTPTTAGPVAKTPSTSTASLVSSVVGVIALLSALF
jgi:hypothetical protein